MISWPLTFFICAVVAGLFAFSGILVSGSGLLHALFFVFTLLWLACCGIQRFKNKNSKDDLEIN